MIRTAYFSSRLAGASCALCLLLLTGVAQAATAPPTTPSQKSLLLQMQDAFSKIAQTVEPAVVNIKAERSTAPDVSDNPAAPGPTPKGGLPFLFDPKTRAHVPQRMEATGSGVIVRSDGYILTNDHVVNGALGGLVMVTLSDGREFKGKVYPDFRSDLAVVKIDPGATPLPAAQFADSGLVQPGQWAIAVGSPFDLQNTMTVGVISAVGRHQSIPGEGPGEGRYYPDLIQTDAAINPGNSGGPLFNIDGQVVGINVAIESPVEGSAGVGFAIPSRIAQQVMSALIGQGKVARGFLGLAPTDLTPAMQTEFGQKNGAFVSDVSLDSPAGKAGLQATDIITEFNGKPITGENDLRDAIAATTPGSVVSIAYVRDGHPKTASAKIETAPELPAEAAPSAPLTSPTQPTLGLTVREITPGDRQSLNLPPGTTGVVIAAMEPGSPAEAAAGSVGLSMTGTILQKIGATPITSKSDFEKAVSSLSGDSETTLVVLAPVDGKLHQSAIPVHF